MRRTILVLALGAMTVSGPVRAATFLVANLADAGPGSLRQAVLDANAAPGPDEVLFEAGVTGTIRLVDIISITDALAITGPGANSLSVSDLASGGIFSINGGAGGEISVALTGLTITGASGTGIFVGNGSLTLSDSVVSRNRSFFPGGGLYFSGGSHVIRRTTIVDNESYDYTLQAGQGGGIVIHDGTLTIEDSTITGNLAGGGVFHFDGSGGGLYASDSTVNVINSTFSGNTVVGEGAAAYIRNSTLNLFLTTVENNGFAGIDRSGFASLALDGGVINLDSSIVANTTGFNATDLRRISGTVNALYSLIETPGTAINGTNSYNVTGRDPRLGPLQDNGGPTETHALLPGSPALDVGDPAVSDQPPFDQRGPGFPRVVGPVVDMGSYESQTLSIVEVPFLSPLGMVVLISALLAAARAALARVVPVE